MIEINLIPDVKQELIRAQRTRAAVITVSIFTSIAAGAVVVLLLLYVFGVQTVRSSILDGQIEDGASQLAEVEDLSKMLTIQNQLAGISKLDGDKNMSSRVFDMLSAVTPAGSNSVRFSQITVNDKDSLIRLEGQTAGYDSMEVFRKTVSSALIEYTEEGETEPTTVVLADKVSITNVSYGQDTSGERVLRFVLTFEYAPELFARDTTAPTFRLSLDGNVTDSFLGIPKSLFTERARDIE